MKSCIPSISQNGNILFRRFPFYLSVILLLMTVNHLKSQTEFVSSYVIIPEEERNEITMAPGLVINTSMIEKFLTISFSTGTMNLNSMILRYDLDSLKIALESVMRRNDEFVSGSETSSDDISSSGNRQYVHSE